MAQPDLTKDVEDIKESVEKLRSDLSKVTQTMIEKGKSETEAAKDRLIEELKFELEAAKDKGKEKVEDVERQIQDKPFMSMIIAFIIGLVIGKFFDKK